MWCNQQGAYVSLLLANKLECNLSNKLTLCGSPKRIHPNTVVIDQHMRFFNLLSRHLLHDLFLRDRGIGIAANGAQDIPQIRACEIGCGHTEANLIIPTDTALRARVALHGRAQIPFKRALIVLFHPKAQRVHHSNQFLRIRIARARRGPERLARLFKAALLHQITALFDFGAQGRAQKQQYRQYLPHSLVLALTPFAALANDLPPPLSLDQFHPSDPQKARIGQLLFYDKILSGNQNISCGTCHHHDLGGTDGLSLGIGEGGTGLGPKRTAGTGEDRIRKRIPRNAPALWNIGHKSIRNIFHDGRLSVSDIYGNGFNSPAEEWLPKGLDTITSAQALFPLTAQFEMAGNPKENEVAGAVHDRIDAAWPIIAKRVRVIPEYAEMFTAAFEDVKSAQDISIVHIGNALGAFINEEWRSMDSPFDAYLAGNAPLPNDAARGMALFFGEANCASCHSGPLFTDQEFHALSLPAFGPGRTRRFDPMARDVGRMGESDALEDAYRFRTPSLRNVELTAPYGHNGAFPTLETMIAHHADPLKSKQAWTRDTANLPAADWIKAIDFVIQSDAREMARQNAALDITPIQLIAQDIGDLTAFLKSLTGVSRNNRPLGRPDNVPSGLPVD